MRSAALASAVPAVANSEPANHSNADVIGANDPYKSLKTALRAEIDEEAWSTLYSDVSRPFPASQRGMLIHPH